MKYRIDHDYHIHSSLSSCSGDPLETKEALFNYAKTNGLSEICVTDHYWDSAVQGASSWYAPQNFEHIASIKPLPEDAETKFLFGCETDMDKHLALGIPKERFDDFDFVIIPTTHLHMRGFTIEESDIDSNAARAKLWVKRFDALLNSDIPFRKVGIAHLVCCLLDNRSHEHFLKTLSLIPDDDMERLFCRAAEVGCGIELNQYDMAFADNEADILLRPFRIAKATGCKFYLGSDAHHPNNFNTMIKNSSRAIDLLGLEEKDKFRLN